MCVFWNEIDTFQDLIQNIDKNMQQQHKWKTELQKAFERPVPY